MNKGNAKDYLPLVQALADGKVIQSYDNYGRFTDLIEVSFNDLVTNYRIKPEPKEIWVNRYPNGVESGPYEDEQEARRLRANDSPIQVRYREVIE
jgi:hypothetical protein